MALAPVALLALLAALALLLATPRTASVQSLSVTWGAADGATFDGSRLVANEAGWISLPSWDAPAGECPGTP